MYDQACEGVFCRAMNWGYPLVNIQKAIENGPFIVDLPIKSGDFP